MGISDSGIGDALAPATGMIGGSIGSLAGYAYWLIPLAVIVAIGLGIFVYLMFRKKTSQWTHTLIMRRVIDNETRLLSKEMKIRMRRFPLIKNAEVFELEKPLFGSYLFPELDKYSGENEYSIVVDTNNRVFTRLGDKFDPDSNYNKISSRHAEIDIQLSNLKADYQNIHKINKRVEWATIAKYAFMAVAIVAIMIVSITAIQNWGEAQAFKAEEAQANADAMRNLGEAMTTVEATVNTQKLEILPLLKELYGTDNIQTIINKRVYANETV